MHTNRYRYAQPVCGPGEKFKTRFRYGGWRLYADP